MEASHRPAALRWLLIGLVALLAWTAAPQVAKVGRAIAFPWALDREEGFLINQAARLREGESIYPKLGENGVFLVGNYPPIFPMAVAAVAVASKPTLAHGRGVVAVALIAICGTLAWAVWRGSGSRVAGACAAIYPFTTFEFAYWTPFARVDIPAAAFALGGVAMAARARSTRGFVIAAALLVAAAFTKQTQVAAVAAAIVAVWISRGRSDALRLAIYTAVPGALLGAVLLATTRGEAWTHLVTYNANEMVWAQLTVWAAHVARFSGILIAACALHAVIGRRAPDEDDAHRHFRIASNVWLVIAAVEALSLAKAGAAANYLIDLQLALALWAGLRMGEAMKGAVSASPMKLATAFILPVGFALQLLLPIPAHRSEILRNVSAPTPEQQLGSENAEATLLAFGTPFLSEDPILSMRRREDVWYQPFVVSQLAKENHPDAKRALDGIGESARPCNVVVTMQDLEHDGFLFGFTEDARRTLLERFQFARRVDAGPVTYYFYARKSAK